jgi:peptidoglycan hydrolase-like protein with peptidoglycan-binding domain
MKSFKNLNARGFSHHFVMVLVVLVTAVGGTYYLVASHAQTPYKNPYTCTSQTQLKAGSKGACVSFLQYALTNSTTSPGLAVDGDFGPNTKIAVQKFQFANHVTGSSCGASYTTCDGIVGPLTWSKVSAFNSAKTLASAPKPTAAAPVKTAPKPVIVAPKPTTATVPAKTAAPAPASATAVLCPGNATTRPALREGSTGNCVRYLQQQLKISQDGIFGGGTNGAVVSFQATHSLTNDGVVGACTWTALAGGARSAACTRSANPATSNSSAAVTRNVTVTPNSYAYGVSSPATRSTLATPAIVNRTTSSPAYPLVTPAPRAKAKSKSVFRNVIDSTVNFFYRISGSN